MTDIVTTIGSGGQRATIQAWLDNAPANLVTSTEKHIGKILSASVLTGGFTDTGHTTNSDYHFVLQCADGESFYNHASKRTNPFRWNSSVGAAVSGSVSAGGFIFDIYTPYFVLDGLQVRKENANAAEIVHVRTGADNVRIRNCIFSSEYPYGTYYPLVKCVDAIGVWVINSLFVLNEGQPALSTCIQVGASAKVIACTFFNIGNDGGYGIDANATPFDLRNTIFCGFGTNQVINANGGTGGYNLTDAVSGLIGSNNIYSAIRADEFESITGSGDFRIKAGADAIGAAPAESSYTNDLDATLTARSTGSPPSGSTVGAWEYVQETPTTFYFPTSDEVDGNWTKSTGGNTDLYSVVGEDPRSDTDYIQSALNPTNDICELGVAVSTPSANTPIVIDYVIRGENNCNIDVSLIAGDASVVKTWQHLGTAIEGASWHEFNQSLTPAEGDTWIAAGTTASRLRFKANAA